MLNKLNTLILLSFVTLVCFFSFACFSENGKMISNGKDLVSPASTKTPNLIETERGYVKAGGWEIPSLESMLLVKTGKNALGDNQLVADYHLYKPTNEMLTTEPHVFLSNEASLIRIQTVTTLSYRDTTFAYSLVAAVVRKDERGNYVQDGPGIVYLYVDEDGDGLFEFLKGDAAPFDIPQWVYKVGGS